jgi:hypothetical protein
LPVADWRPPGTSPAARAGTTDGKTRSYLLAAAERYQQLALCAAVPDGLTVLAFVILAADDASALAVLALPRFVFASSLLVASCFLLPRWAVRAFGRLHSRRHG